MVGVLAVMLQVALKAAASQGRRITSRLSDLIVLLDHGRQRDGVAHHHKVGVRHVLPMMMPLELS